LIYISAVLHAEAHNTKQMTKTDKRRGFISSEILHTNKNYRNETRCHTNLQILLCRKRLRMDRDNCGRKLVPVRSGFENVKKDAGVLAVLLLSIKYY
jgi:hypothetical protein